jgi:ABC-type multidrug transport system ATPase subunit
MNSLLQANNLGLHGKGHYNWLFKNVNLTIGSGDIVVINGNSGSGKSSLMDILCGFKKSSHGFVERNAPVAVATQHFTLYTDLTVQENLDFIAAIYDNQTGNKTEILNWTGLAGWENTRAKNLPVGLRKMLQIACAVVQNTSLLIFDEPTYGLDQSLIVLFYRLVETLTKQNRGIIILTNQSLKLAKSTGDFELSDSGLVALSPTHVAKENEYRYESEGVG